MRAIQNKSKTICACSVIPGLQKRGKKKYMLTEKDMEKMGLFEESLEGYCLLNRMGNCIEDVQGSHTQVAIRHHSHCCICGSVKWEVIYHPAVLDLFPSRSSHSHVLRLPPPELIIPDANTIVADNENMREEDDYY